MSATPIAMLNTTIRDDRLRQGVERVGGDEQRQEVGRLAGLEGQGVGRRELPQPGDQRHGDVGKDRHLQEQDEGLPHDTDEADVLAEEQAADDARPEPRSECWGRAYHLRPFGPSTAQMDPQRPSRSPSVREQAFVEEARIDRLAAESV